MIMYFFLEFSYELTAVLLKLEFKLYAFILFAAVVLHEQCMKEEGKSNDAKYNVSFMSETQW